MEIRKGLIILTFTVLSTLVLGPGVAFGAPCIPCGDLLTTDFGPEVTITSAVTSTEITIIDISGATTIIPVPEHCDVRGTISPEQGFDIKLPTAGWNDKLYVIGNGIAAGQISEVKMVDGLVPGFVTAGTDTGHQGSMLDWSFGYNPPDNSNPNYQEKIDDYCDESIHETTVLAKQVIAAYYCSDPTYSYYVGCSTGGRQALIEAQRYPADFDGLLFGAPVLQLSEIQMRNIWEGQQLAVAPIDVITYPGKLDALADSVMTKCDGIDGLVDGVIDDPRKCNFDARTDLPACPGDVDADNCFTTAQRDAIYAIYDAPRNSAGDLLTFGQPFGSEAFGANLFGPPTYGWNGWIVSDNPMNPVGLNPIIGAGFIQYIGLDPPPGGPPYSYDLMTFDFDTDWPNVMNNTFTSLCNATDPDLSVFRGLGGKIIHYRGWADPATGPYQSAEYYEKVLSFLGDSETKSFYKLYMIPGMFHCGGGLGCFDETSLFTALVDWVESGVTPTTYTGSGVNPGLGPRTRPMCPYPEVAVYSGSGDIDDAANFTCQDPATVISPTSGVVITTSSVTDTIDAGTPPANFTTKTAVSFTASGVSGSADFVIDFPIPLGSNPVIYKVAGTTWGQIYPNNMASGITNVKLMSGVLTFTMDDNSAFDSDSTVGTIEDPIVAGNTSSPSSSQQADGGAGGGCFIGTLLAD